MKSKWYVCSFLAVAACSIGEIEEPQSAQPDPDVPGLTQSAATLTDSSTYGFEGSLQGWSAGSGGVFTVFDSSTRAWAGSQSMAMRFGGRTGKQSAAIANPAFNSGTVTAHLWVPAGAGIHAVQLFTLEQSTWKWRSTWVAASSLKGGAWNTLQLTVPSGGKIASLGLEVEARSSWYGTLYLDAVQLGKPAAVDAGAPPPPVVDAGTPPPPVVDAGTPPPPVVDAGTPPPPVMDAGTPPVVTGPGLKVVGNRILTLDGRRWHGRGANLMDTRSCNACTAQAPNVAEVKRRIDELVNVWKASFIRLDLESYASTDGYRAASNYQSPLYDPTYVANIREIVRYIGTKPGVYVLVSLWTDPSIDSMGRPTLNSTIGTDAVWRKLTQALGDQPHALFGIINEPQMNYDGAGDATVHSLMTGVVRAIRETEETMNVPYHVITVQGTGGWARRLGYYVTHPITERGGQNIAYEVHVYDPQSSFQSLYGQYASTLPIIIGEFGPEQGMTTADCATLMDQAQQLEIPHLAWTFHMRCSPNLIVDNSSGGCGVGMPLTPTSWGNQLKARLATPW